MIDDAITDHEDPPPMEMATVAIAVDALPFTRINTERQDELMRQWIFKEVHGIEVPLTQSTLTYCEAVFQWITKGAQTPPEPKVKVVK